MASIQSLLEDWKNWSNLQDWKLQKQLEEMFGGDYRLAEDVSRWGGGFNPSNIGAGLGGLAGAIKSYHGSPAAFTKFLMSKLGTGEGAQAYGHGLYFAQAPEVAADYAQTLARKEGQVASIGKKSLTDFYAEIENKANKLPPHLAEKEYEKLAFLEDLDQQPTFQSALSRIDDPDVEAWAKTLEKSYTPAGNMYEVSLQWPNAAKEAADPLGEQHLLDWDAPYQQQPSHIQELLKNYYSDVVNKRTNIREGLQAKFAAQGKVAPIREEMSPVTGQQLYDQIASQLNSRELASNFLAEKGIPGIRYLDQGSRVGTQKYIARSPQGGENTFNSAEEAKKFIETMNRHGVDFEYIDPNLTRNYVMFDERFPNIVSRNRVSLVDLLRK